MIRRGVFLLSVLVLFACAPKKQSSPSYQLTPAPSEMLLHTVNYSGETLALISLWYTGKSTNWQTILLENPGLRPERIRLGDTIRIPRALVIKDEPLPQGFLRSISRPAAKETTEIESSVTSSSSSGGEVKKVTDSDAPPADSAAKTSSSATVQAVDTTSPSGAVPSDAAAASAPKVPADAERERLLDELLGE